MSAAAKPKPYPQPRLSSVPHGVLLLHDPLHNKGTAFTEAERDALGLRGLLPPRVLTQEQQVKRVQENLARLPTDLERYVALNSLQERNCGLFFRLVIDNPDQIMPIIYTPTVGLGCQKYAHVFQKPHGMFISAREKGRIREVLKNWPTREVDIIVVTDGERILGLGDLGANGMGIPVGKLSLYVACAGVDPARCLPITLDVGTDNEELLQDDIYIGLAQKRMRGRDYDEFVEEFIAAATETFPGVLIQFEDFANANAFRLLETYRDRVCCFNDDIQGTASVVLSGLYSALRITGGKLADQKILCLGAGEAATGICDLAVASMVRDGLGEAEARKRCWLVDSKGLVVASRTDLNDHKRPYAHEHAAAGDFLSAVEALKPTAIIGVAAKGGMFTREVLEAMARINERPIVFALSNPTSKSECTAEEAYRHTAGKALFACGSPFAPVTLGDQTFVPRQGNNSYIFPGVGMGVISCRSSRVTDEMFLAAASALADQVGEDDLKQGSLYPPLANVREVSAHIAAAVAKVAYDAGLATEPKPADLLEFIRSRMYDPRYPAYA
ncbi:MAG TPA: NAD-dependent malic enzyme [Pelomicrobium sp.]|nr:NAD-dependent malic enzyme [Pelomicrobium sp.]